MYYPDLTPYTYFDVKTTSTGVAPIVLNVGWLDRAHAFPTGTVSEQFLDCLFALCLQKVNQTRGGHRCQFCRGTKGNLQLAARVGQVVGLGSAEMRATGPDGTIYAAPNLIYHYVAVHSYLPPEPFIEAVLHSCIEPIRPE